MTSEGRDEVRIVDQFIDFADEDTANNFCEKARELADSEELLAELDHLIAPYGITDEELNVYEYEDLEVETSRKRKQLGQKP